MTQQYYGPAGLFSTDSPYSDQLQIECEQFWQEPDVELAGVDCGNCGEDLYLCTCLDYPEQEPYFSVVASCPINNDWYDYNLSVPESEVDFVTNAFNLKHTEKCKCGGKLEISVQKV